MKTKNSFDNLPLVALVGPTNAGKSTLFNRLTGSYQSVTAREESTTRDRVYGQAVWQDRPFNLVDTGGLVTDASELYQAIKKQTLQAVEEADLILFVYDGRIGLTPSDKQFLDSLRSSHTIWLVANKIDSASLQQTVEKPDYLGFPVRQVAAISGGGVGDLMEAICTNLPATGSWPLASGQTSLIALIGRPNVGKSTLLNALAKSERAVVSPIPGTTRDVVTEKISLAGRTFWLADTAGVRRRGRIEPGVESFSVKRTLQTIRLSTLVIVLADATEGTTRGDLHLIYFAESLGKPVLLILNKTDLVDRVGAIGFHPYLAKFAVLPVSAKTGYNVNQVARWILDHAPSP